MKKKNLLMLFATFALSFVLCGCQSEPDPNEIIKDALVGEWKNVTDGDIYTFSEDGTGTHGDVTITYKVENEVIAIVEGASNMTEVNYALDMTDAENYKLIPEDKSTYYVAPEKYDVISEQIKAENLAILMSYEYWSNTQGLNYVMFSETGGWFLLSGVTLPLTWEWQDSNTIKLSTDYNGTVYSNVVTLVNDNGEYRLVNDMGETSYLPKNPLN